MLGAESEVESFIGFSDLAQPRGKFSANLANLAVAERAVRLAKKAHADAAQSEHLVSPDEIEHQPPAQDVAFTAAGFSAVENEIFVGDGLQKFTLEFSWVYQPFQAHPRRA